MADVKIIDIDNEQWNMKDQEARTQINNIKTELAKITDIVFNGAGTFNAHMKYLGEDNNYIYYNFWWDAQRITLQANVAGFFIYPSDTNNDKIVNLNLNILQDLNSAIVQATQQEAGPNNSGIYTYIKNANENTGWTISGMGILKRAK